MNFKRFGRTANLFDYQTMEGTIKGYYLDSNGDLQESAFAAVTDYIPCSGGKFCLAKVGGISTSICLYDNNKHFLYGQAYNTSSGSDKQTIVVNSSVNASYIRFTYFYTAAPQDDLSAIMLNAGSTALPYQPYMDWTNTPHYIHNTSTDTITTLPADIYANDTTAIVGLKGNMSQSSQPSPTTPIQPSECGERTGNLFSIDFAHDDYSTLVYHYTISGLTPNNQYTCSSNFEQSGTTASIWFGGTASGANGVSDGRPKTMTANANGEIDFYINRNTAYTQVVNGTVWIMLNTGSTPLPYEPFGVKIPISSANTTTPVYLGEVQSTRKIGKYIFTGDENITRSVSASNVRMYYVISSAAGASPLYCTHFVDYAQAAGYPPVGYCNFNNISNFIMGVDGTEFETADDFKTWLRTQYTNGNPLTVWYVLATPTTGIVNEPIRKIGEYADTVSGITIPTIAGANTLSIGTTLQPSEVTVNYKGWHPVQSVHEAGRTVNIYDKYNTVDIQDLGTRYGIYCNIGTYSIYNNTDNIVYWGAKDFDQRHEACQPHSTATVTMYGQERGGFFMPYNNGSLGEVTIVQGSTVPDHYIPYIDWD